MVQRLLLCCEIYYTLYSMRWLVLSYSLPSKPSSSLRVTLWRRLQRLGALPVTGAYVLPERPDCLESFTWLAQEIGAAEGEALIMAVERFEGLSDRSLVERFNQLRAEVYEEVLSELDKLEQPPEADNLQAIKRLAKLRRRFTELRRTDFFNSPIGKEVAAKLTRLEQRHSPQPPEEMYIQSAKREDYQGKTWVTRPQPHVDRLASIWLIKHFIDPEAKFRYHTSPEADEIGFDMEGVRFGHTGSLCTFETLLAAFTLEGAALTQLAQIVHEMDLRDERYVRSEIAGLDAILDGWLTLGLSDEELEQRGVGLFEGLYATLTKA